MSAKKPAQGKQACVLRHPKLTKAGLITLLQKHFPSSGSSTRDQEKPRYLAFRPNNSDFWYFEPAQAGVVIVNWEEGRVFSPTMEVRWRKVEEDAYDVLILSEQDISEEGFQPIGEHWRAVRKELDKSGFYLWGTHRPRQEETWRGHSERPYWLEVRIPKPLHYPIQAAGAEESFPRVGYYLYLDASDVVRFIRLAEVKDEEPQPQKI